jgi:hypothetical protein
MKKTTILFLLSLQIIFFVYGSGNNAFEDLCQIINNQGDPSQTYALDHELRRQPVSGRGYIVSVDKDGFGTVIVRLSTTRDLFSPTMISVTVYPTKSYFEEALRYRKGDYVYFSGILSGASGIAREIIIHNAAVSISHEVITR